MGLIHYGTVSSTLLKCLIVYYSVFELISKRYQKIAGRVIEGDASQQQPVSTVLRWFCWSDMALNNLVALRVRKS